MVDPRLRRRYLVERRGALVVGHHVARRRHGKPGVARQIPGVKHHVLDVVQIMRAEHPTPGIERDPVPTRRLVGDLQLAGVRSEPEVHAADRHSVIGRASRLPAAVVPAVGGVDPVVEPPGQPVDVVLRVADRKSGEQRFAAVGDVVAVGVLQEEDVGRRGHQHAAAPGQDRGRMLKLSGEQRDRLVVAVAVGVVE